VILDDYTTRLRALQIGRPDDPKADQLLAHDDARQHADQAIAEVDRLASLIDRDRSGRLVRTRMTEGV
jgi:hypothetical protein